MTIDFYQAFKDPDRLANILKDLIPSGSTTVTPPPPQTFGDALETTRLSLNLSSTQLAQRLNIATPHLESYLNNETTPTAGEMERIITIIKAL